MGWRWAMVPAIVACGIAAMLTVLMGEDDPAELGIAAFGDTGVSPPPSAGASLNRSGLRRPRQPQEGAIRLAFRTLAEVSDSRVFWMLFVTFFMCGLSTTGLVQIHLLPLCMDHGIGPIEAAGFLAVIGGFDFIGTIGSGWLSDRFDNRWRLLLGSGVLTGRGVAGGSDELLM